MQNPLHIELDWINQQIAQARNPKYSSDKYNAILYELGLTRALLAQCIHNDSANRTVVRTVLNTVKNSRLQ